jgi:hypothetical protein
VQTVAFTAIRLRHFLIAPQYAAFDAMRLPCIANADKEYLSSIR